MADNIRFQMKQIIKQAVQNIVLPVCYGVNRTRAVDPKLVVFADAHHNSRPAAMELFYQKLKESGRYRIVEHYLDYGSAGAGAVAKHSIQFMKLYASSSFVVICDNFLPVASCRKRPQTKVIQLWHACGCYKKFGYDAKDDIPENYHGANVYRNADLVTVSGEAAVKPFASAMRLPECCVKPLGVSRTDLYFRDSWREECRKKFCERYHLHREGENVNPEDCKLWMGENAESEDRKLRTGENDYPDECRPWAQEKKIVLWAPTFRGNAGVPEMISLDLERLQQELGEEYLVLAHLHPHMCHKPDQSGGPQELNHSDRSQELDQIDGLQGKQFNCDIPTEELYPVVDVLIADYSSLIYEYLLFAKIMDNKKLVLYVPDLEEYRRNRGFYMPIEEIPAQIVTREDALADAIREAAGQKDARSREENSGRKDSFGRQNGFGRQDVPDMKDKTARKDENVRRGSSGRNDVSSLETFLRKYMGACDGHATDRIVEWMKTIYWAKR